MSVISELMTRRQKDSGFKANRHPVKEKKGKQRREEKRMEGGREEEKVQEGRERENTCSF